MSVVNELDDLIDQLDRVLGADSQADSKNAVRAGGGAGSAVVATPRGDAQMTGEVLPTSNRAAQIPVAAGSTAGGDAIDAVLGGARRRTQAATLLDSSLVREFRTDLVNGLVRIDRLSEFLRLLTVVAGRFLK